MVDEPDVKLRKPSIWQLGSTDLEKQKISDRFFIEKTPEWFEFVGWLFVIGGLQYFAEKTHHWFVVLLLVFSYGFLYFYLNAFLYTFPFYRLLPDNWIKTDRVAHVFSVSVAGVLWIIIFLALRTVIEIFSEIQP